MPQPYLDMLLCERFGWTPTELGKVDAELILEYVTMWAVEQEVAKKEGKGKGKSQR